MDYLRIWMFGDLRLSMAGKQLPGFATREAERLFAFLLLNRERQFSRETLSETFFSDHPVDAALKRLRTTIWRIRSVLEPDGTEAGTYLTITKREVGFNEKSDYWLDIQEFENRVSEVTTSSDSPLDNDKAGLLFQAIDLYRGDLLEGVYDEWCLWEQERLKMLHLRGLEMLMAHHAAGSDWSNAIFRGQQLLSHDPMREHIHRSLMRYYYLVGDRPAALAQYDSCAKLLMEELGIEPMRETASLYQAIKEECAVADLADEQNEARKNLVSPATYLEQDRVSELYDSAAHLEQAIRHLHHGIAWVEHFINKN